MPVFYDNLAETPPDSAPWVRLTVTHGDGAQVAMGATRRWRHAGLAVVQVFVPAGEGDGTALAIADDAASVFRGVSVAGVSFRAPGLARLGPEGAWYQVQVSVPWRADLEA